jgi:RimJ/RimL family protein N-acetyltransferase
MLNTLVRFIETTESFMLESLTYEPLHPRHASELYGEWLDDRQYQYIPERPPRSLDSLEREYTEFNGGAPEGSGEVWLNWAIRERASNTCVGTLQATRFADGLVWVGFKVIPSAWRRGIATEALSWLTRELNSVFPNQSLLAAVDTRNIASIRVLQKCDFTLLRQEAAELHDAQTEDFIYRFDSASPVRV